MTRTCCVQNCSNEKNNSSKSYFEIPWDTNRRSQWCNILNVEFRCYHKRYVCEDHFEGSQFSSSGRSRLKKAAIPLKSTTTRPLDHATRSPLGNITNNLNRNQLSTSTGPQQVSQMFSSDQNVLVSQPSFSTVNSGTVYPFPNSTQLFDHTIGSPLRNIDTNRLNRNQLSKSPTPHNVSQNVFLFQPPVSPANSASISPITFSPSVSSQLLLQSFSSSPVALNPNFNSNSAHQGQFQRVSDTKSVEGDVFVPPNLGVSLPSPSTKWKRKFRNVSQQNRRLTKRLLKFTDKKVTLEEAVTKQFQKTPALVSLIHSQIHRFNSPRQHYTDQEKVIALTLFYSCGRKGYRTLKQIGMHLPHLRTIRRWLENFDLKPGLNDCLLDAISDRVKSMNDYERDTVLVFDEMHIKRHLLYNKNSDEIEGIEDHGNHRRSLKAATQASVTMIRGLNTNWILPLCYGFSQENTTTNDLQITLEECLEKLYKIGLKVRIIVSDMGFTNQALHLRLGATVEQPFIERHGRKIYVVFDTPHLIKLVRNHLKKTGFDVDEKKVRWSHVEKFFDMDVATPDRMAPRITKYHINVTELSKQKVKYATQVLSKSVADGIRTLVKLNKMRPTTLVTAAFIEKMDKLFDLLNISEEENHIKPWKAGRNVFTNLKVLKDLKTWVSEWKMPGGKAKPDCIGGLLKTINAIVMLVTDLKNEGYGFVLTRRMQQDCVENYFSQQRFRCGSHTNPTTVEFRHNFRYLFITNVLRNPEGSNCEDTEVTNVLLDNMKKCQSIFSAVKSGNNITVASQNTDSEDSEDEFEDSGTEPESNDEERIDIVINDFFAVEEIEDIPLKDDNVNVYMGNWAVKASIKLTKCKQCMEMLHFPTVFDDEADTLLIEKSYQYFENLRGGLLSYRHVLNSENKEALIHIGNRFRPCLRIALNEEGTFVLRSVYRLMKQDEKIGSWLKPSDVQCRKHREIAIKLLLRAKMLENAKYKQIKSKTQTREELRHQ